MRQTGNMVTGSNIIDQALRIALEVHVGQKDRYGVPYILHPIRVGLAGASDEEIAAGFLHDVVEDSEEWSIQRLEGEGFPTAVITMVDCLTKREGEEWKAYIGRVLTDKGAMRVKLADLEHNMTAQRISVFGEREAERFARYVWAWHKIHHALREQHS